MEIQLSTELIAGIVGSIGLLILALLTALLWSVRAIIQTSKTNIALNNEAQEHSEYRRKAEKEYGELKTITDDLKTQVTTIQVDCETRENALNEKIASVEQRASQRETDMNAEIAVLNTKITELESEIERLQRSLEVERDLRRADLDAFQKQINEKNAQIAELKQERDQLRSRLDKLETAMNGKLDKPSTEELTREAELIAAQHSATLIVPATGAMGDQSTLDTERKTNDGTI